MTAYYNEIEPYAAQWLRNLISAGHIAPGDVDERSIADVQSSDLTKYTQCHFFAGIGGWSYALRLAGWPDERPVWTGSCPCQPFSDAGKRKGFADERHLWPQFRRLVGERRPAIVFGEQVASADGVAWADEVGNDFEAANYAFGTAILPASCVGAPHQRDRFYFVAHAIGADAARRTEGLRGPESLRFMAENIWPDSEWEGRSDAADGVDDGLPAVLAKRCVGGFGNAIVPQVAAEFIRAAS